MLLSTLAQKLAEQVRLIEQRPAGTVAAWRACFDSRRVQPGDLYCALPGTVQHGIEYLSQAEANGAVACLTDRPSPAATIPQFVINSDRNPAQVAGMAAAAIADDPSQQLHVSAVTGTNGKSTIVHLLEQAWNHNQVAAGRVGTLGYCFGNDLEDSLNTTPSADQLHQWLRKIVDQDAKAVALEASSHGIHQQRLAGANIDTIGWTNLSHDHLDYHGDLESYAAAKAALIHEHADATALIPAGDARIWRAVEGASSQLLSWSVFPDHSTGSTGNANTVAPDLWATTRSLPEGQELNIGGMFGSGALRSSLIGHHNAENLLLAFGLLRLSGLDVNQCLQGLQAATSAPGRLQRVAPESPWNLFVDYAHTPEALQRVLAALRDSYPQQRIGIVCGAGGDRDPVKRGPMGRAAAEGADWCMLTSDNPRTENPDAILDAVVDGAEQASSTASSQSGQSEANTIMRQVDRRLAIQQAVARLQPGDVLLVAGKGHEPYQEIHGVRHPFDDRLELEEAVKCCS